jgi:hypothetical protein
MHLLVTSPGTDRACIEGLSKDVPSKVKDNGFTAYTDRQCNEQERTQRRTTSPLCAPRDLALEGRKMSRERKATKAARIGNKEPLIEVLPCWLGARKPRGRNDGRLLQYAAKVALGSRGLAG